MSSLRERIERKLRNDICQNCFAAEPGGACNFRETGHCPLFARLGDIMDIVNSVRDDSLDPYLDKIRTIICSSCAQKPSGYCAQREHLNCALDAYLPLVVSIIETELSCESPGTAVYPSV